MRIVNIEGATVLNHEGVTYEADGDVFDVPHDVGDVLIRFPHFITETDALAKDAEERARRDRDPKSFANRLAALETQVAELVDLVTSKKR